MPFNITPELVRQLMEQNASLLKQNEELAATVRELTQTIRELREQLNQNSKNGSKPPSSDGLKKQPVKKDRSLRKASGSKPGAQSGHDGVKEGSFPTDIRAAVQYGRNLQALAVALNTVGAVSIDRTHEILSSVFSIPLSTGTIKNMVTRCADSLRDTYEKLRRQMLLLGLIHYDEIGTRVDGKTWWVHNASGSAT